MTQIVSTPGGRDVTVRPVSRHLPARYDGSSFGYRVDYLDYGATIRVTYNADQLSAGQLGELVHELATRPAVRP